ncbi:MAG: hypothetical protein RIS47_2225 [Bacteroidota bacterium]|jgi:benzil reductase ((S)-benzoin forming)
MHYYYITGASKGIGKALALSILETTDSYVIGISRSQSIQHERYEHLSVNLLNIADVTAMQFIPLPDAESIQLVNNAGLIGEIKPTGQETEQGIEATYTLNSIVPAILTNRFVAAYQHQNCRKTILNISSGAARHPIASWSAYCASKAALDMQSQVLATEQQRAKHPYPIRSFSVAPGIVDTEMQSQIRNSSISDFPDYPNFVNYHKNLQLSKPDLVAEKLADILHNPENYTEVLLKF